MTFKQMVSKENPVPSFKKGDFVIPNSARFLRCSGSRQASHEEKQAYYADPRNQGMGDDGESKVWSGTVYVPLPAGTQMVVTRARVQAQVGWGTQGNMCEVKVIGTNEVLVVSRRELQLGQ